jgi:hypothetical protein
LKDFNEKLLQSLGDRAQGINLAYQKDEVEEYLPYKDKNETPLCIQDTDEINLDLHHKYILSKVMLPQGDRWPQEK